MSGRIILFVGATLGGFAAISMIYAIGWALLSFTFWRLLGPPPLEVVRLVFGICCLGGFIIAVGAESIEGRKP